MDILAKNSDAYVSAEELVEYKASKRRLSDIQYGMDARHAEGLAEGRREGRREGLAEGRQEGLAEGRQEGRQEANLKMALNLHSDGIPREKIKQYTGLSDADLDELNI